MDSARAARKPLIEPANDTLPVMQTEIVTSIREVAEHDWNRLNHDDNPFTSHAFLDALEESGCIGGMTGWQPRHLVLREEGRLVAALPMYAKSHSWGEYVFDWAWAEAWQRFGLPYYPKLVVAVPFSPVTGRRLLMTPALDVHEQLIEAATRYARNEGYSSVHWLFPTSEECTKLEQYGLQIRHGVQFQWYNRQYHDFADFLAGMTSRKRKNIVRERRRVQEQGIRFEVVTGENLTPAHLDQMYTFYLHTIRLHGSQAYLNRAFFRLLGERLAEHTVLILAARNGETIAGALNIRSGNTLYGRYWGSRGGYDSLHFETCYYQAIDYCIHEGISRFEGGAQGEHKLSRGFLPQVTCSAHWLANARMSDGIRDFLVREKAHVAHYRDLLNEHSPYRQNQGTSE
jgi:hypothetical protein